MDCKEGTRCFVFQNNQDGANPMAGTAETLKVGVVGDINIGQRKVSKVETTVASFGATNSYDERLSCRPRWSRFFAEAALAKFKLRILQFEK